MARQSIKSALQTITVSRAKTMLGSMAPNRPIRWDYVDALARIMLEGKFDTNGQSVIIDWDGNLQDGQHRLHAVIKSGIAIRVIVVTGVDPAVFETIDTGNTRSTRDILKLKGYDNPAQRGATINQLYLWHTRGNIGPESSCLRTTEVILAAERLDSTLLGLCVAAALDAKKMFKRVGTMAALGYISGADNYGKFETFCRLLRTGEGMAHGNPILTLRERIVAENDRSKIPPAFLGFAVAKSYAHFARSKNLSVIKRAPNEAFPTIPGENGCKLPWDKLQAAAA